MRLNELFLGEYRKNPEQNPKTPINKVIADEIASAKGKLPNGDVNLFISLTSESKLGINPQSEYDTPVGIYSYPATYVLERAGDTKSLGPSLPFAGENPYLNFFTASGNIVFLQSVTDSVVKEYLSKMAAVLDSTGLLKDADAKDWVAGYYSDSQEEAHVKTPGGRLWYVFYAASDWLTTNKWASKPSVAWTKLCRAMGIDGFYDDGDGIIHTNEPVQAVFFNTKAIHIVSRHMNKYSPSSVKSQRSAAAYKTDLHKDFMQFLADPYGVTEAPKSIPLAQLVVDYARPRDLRMLKYVQDPDIRKGIITLYGNMIWLFAQATPDEQLLALEATDGSALHVLEKLRNPSEDAVLRYMDAHPEKYAAATLLSIFGGKGKQMSRRIRKEILDISPEYAFDEPLQFGGRQGIIYALNVLRDRYVTPAMYKKAEKAAASYGINIDEYNLKAA